MLNSVTRRDFKIRRDRITKQELAVSYIPKLKKLGLDADFGEVMESLQDGAAGPVASLVQSWYKEDSKKYRSVI